MSTMSRLAMAKETLLEFLYDTPKVYYEKKLATIIEENNALNGHAYAYGGVIYEGKIYSTFSETPSSSSCYRVHGELEERFKALLQDMEDLDNERYIVGRTLSAGLSVVLKKDDIETIFGRTLYSHIEVFFRNIDTNLNIPNYDSRVDTFIETYSQYIEIMNQRVLMNTIMQGEFNKK